jgi:hypothetical protein
VLENKAYLEELIGRPYISHVDYKTCPAVINATHDGKLTSWEELQRIICNEGPEDVRVGSTRTQDQEDALPNITATKLTIAPRKMYLTFSKCAELSIACASNAPRDAMSSTEANESIVRSQAPAVTFQYNVNCRVFLCTIS